MYSTHNVRPIPPISWSVEAEPPKVIVIALQCARQTKPNKNRVSQNTGAYSKSTSLANTNIRWDGQRIHRSPPANSISISIKQKPNELVLWLWRYGCRKRTVSSIERPGWPSGESAWAATVGLEGWSKGPLERISVGQANAPA